MKITKFEQSGVIIETDKGYKLAIDIGCYTPLEKLVGIKVDSMLVSHIHGDHFSVEHIKKISPKNLYINKECIDALGQESIPSEIKHVKVGDNLDEGDFGVHFFDVDHGPNVKLRPKENFGFLINIDNKKIYFAGDMFSPSGIDVSQLEVDIALIPIGTFYTFGPSEALSFVRKFKRIGEIIPMHYEKNPETKEEFEKLINNISEFKV